MLFFYYNDKSLNYSVSRALTKKKRMFVKDIICLTAVTDEFLSLFKLVSRMLANAAIHALNVKRLKTIKHTYLILLPIIIISRVAV